MFSTNPRARATERDPPQADNGLTWSLIYAIFPRSLRRAPEPFLFKQNKKNSPPPSVLTEIVKKNSSIKGAIDPFHCVAKELDLVEENLLRSIRSTEPSLTDIAAHLILGGGKRIRPMVTLLAYKVFGGKKLEDIIDIATAIELIHTATLLHDDILDGAEIRRGKQSAYKKYGLKATLVAGDFLFIKAFEFAGKFDVTVVQWTADACTCLTEGEILQGVFNRNMEVTLEDYLEIVRRKTASLFQTGARIGAYLAGAAPSSVEAMSQFGLNLGIAFQIIDDVLDVVGHKELLGKPVGMDLRDGNPSLPIIFSIQDGEPAVAHAFQANHLTEAMVQSAIEVIGRGAAIEKAKAFSRIYAARAFELIQGLPTSLYRNGLKTLVQLIVERNF